ncbi:hypothetical protein MYSTI_07928 [Myxococcus stipitatus DSM 14675]|uniref:Type I-MYXAN CRISPR-associated protein Cmx8 n=1 Tax=Myxococcus stipitatus (strain DSM 14675 / JCM 12634 / Mx s8) TaxID=1278073 RepID=L7UMT2_MYXSD|nr:type I-MYXAN CRISPR-associated protein Cmx8 [Myxococcus stipitatus]AGC49200.1 hypothetical protein MYSTI_07928 [Myxococcus stipitatus DSM 14675]
MKTRATSRRSPRTKAPPSARGSPRSRNDASPERTAPLVLDYQLAELPTAQHRAGLAGLVLMLRWLERLPGAKPGTARLARLDDASARVELDPRGLQRLFDELYAARLEEKWEKKPRDGARPLREDVKVVRDKKGETRRERYFIYEVPVPRAGLLLSMDPTASDRTGHWVKLWRDMLWSTLRGVPTTRGPFISRALGESTSDAAKAWKLLTAKRRRASVSLSSTELLGAMEHNAEGVSFEDLPRTAFLLHFWPYVTQVYVPRTLVVKERRVLSDPRGYALAIPDVARLRTFCEVLPRALLGRGTALRGFRPQESMVDLAVESALMTGQLLRRRLSKAEGALAYSSLVWGYDVFHLGKDGNNVRTHGASRFEPEVEMVDAYAALQGSLKDALFRRTCLLNLVKQRPWYAGFDRVFATSPHEVTLGAMAFRQDARLSLERHMHMDSNASSPSAPSLEQLVFQVARHYVLVKLERKHKLRWDAVKDDPSLKKTYNEKKEVVARDAFLAVRSRSGQDFIAYFAGTLCSVPQHLPVDQFVRLSQALQTQHEDMKTLTLLALSANA